MKISVLENRTKDPDGTVLSKVLNAFKDKADISVYTDALSANYFENVDFAISLGGDGTIIRTAKYAAPAGVPVCGINLGKVGFLASCDVDEIPQMADNLLSGNYTVNSRMMLDVCISGIETHRFCALNDVALTRMGHPKMIDINIAVNGEFLDNYLADGVLIATPTGSTAYSLSAGGPVAEPCMELCIVTPICAYDLQTRPIILPADKKISFTLGGGNRFEAGCSIDGQNDIPIKNGDTVTVTKLPYSAKITAFGTRSFYSVLRKKTGKITREMKI